tara:strand:- start:187 stop:465 length:279 start_codon:yes stop_codon:yes gene_type:complete
MYIATMLQLQIGGTVMAKGSIFTNNRTQAVRLPAQMRFDDDIKQVSVRIVGKERILCPLENTWDSFFMQDQSVDDDFMSERAEQTETKRESF